MVEDKEQRMAKRLNILLLSAILGVLGACSSSSSSPQREIAPPPPNFAASDISTDVFDPSQEEMYAISDSKLTPIPEIVGVIDSPEEELALKTSKVYKKCRLKDRFDRKALFAYEWNNRRLSLDVDGINYGSSKIDRIRMEYKVSLQPELTKKNRCLHVSRFQGLLGSGYNEFVVKKGDTVWGEVRSIQAQTLDYIGSVVD